MPHMRGMSENVRLADISCLSERIRDVMLSGKINAVLPMSSVEDEGRIIGVYSIEDRICVSDGSYSPSNVLELTGRIIKMIEELEDILGVQITNKDINNSIAVYNENRQALREFSDLVAENPGLIRLRDRHAVIKARWFMEKSRHTALLKELNDAIRSAEKVPFNGKRVIVSGITLEPYEVLDIFEEFGFAIVADDLAHETRNFRQDVPQDEDPLMALARAWNLFDGCSLATDADKPKGRILIDAVNKYKADAVIICMMKFCDPEEFDYPILLQEFAEAGVKNLQIEIDQETTSFEQIRTRIQTFSEVI